jgi:formate hydrogenlyase subunit 3/multisubunit Na+/H+ antiporter MnhD subunit
MAVTIALGCVAALLAVACLAVAIVRARYAGALVYRACLLISAVGMGVGVAVLLAGSTPVPTVTLPLGLPWIGAHFRLDVLSAFFLAVVNLGAAAASLFALGYGRHEESPERVLPF